MTFNNLPAHSRVRITGKYHIVDCWESGKRFYVRVDGVNKVDRNIFHWVNAAIPSVCGDARVGCGEELN